MIRISAWRGCIQKEEVMVTTISLLSKSKGCTTRTGNLKNNQLQQQCVLQQAEVKHPLRFVSWLHNYIERWNSWGLTNIQTMKYRKPFRKSRNSDLKKQCHFDTVFPFHVTFSLTLLFVLLVGKNSMRTI